MGVVGQQRPPGSQFQSLLGNRADSDDAIVLVRDNPVAVLRPDLREDRDVLRLKALENMSDNVTGADKRLPIRVFGPPSGPVANQKVGACRVESQSA